MLGSASPGLILITSGAGGSADPPVLTSTAANCTGVSLVTGVNAASGSFLSSSRLLFDAEPLLDTVNLLALGLPSLPIKHVQRKGLSAKERTGCLAMIKAVPPQR